MRTAFAAGLLLGLVGFASAQDLPQEMKAPRLSVARVDWPAAVASLAELAPAAPIRRGRLVHGRAVPTSLVRLNAVMSQHFAGLRISPVPVLLPFDVAARLRDQDMGAVPDEARYLSGFDRARFFYPGPAGYDAAFAIRAADVPQLSDVKFAEPIEVQISGSALLYDLDTPAAAEGHPVASLEADFPGIRKTILEHHLRYTFVRFGVPYAVSTICFDTASPRFRIPSCRTADAVVQHFLRSLRLAGGMPHAPARTKPWPVERPERASHTFAFHGPGRIQSNTGFRGNGGRSDYTVYSRIRFPLAEAPAYAGSELFQRSQRTRIADASDAPTVAVTWRDNFCERRGFSVSQCPAGIGHQGQDLRPLICKPAPNSDRCDPPGDVVAARGGMILRSPRQEAAYLFVNSANEHIRFRYLHMNPRKMDADNLLSGRRVHEGEVIGEVGNYSMRDAGTSYHLHFDIQVPTRDGWVFVNPYMTLVAAYERLIGERGTELPDPRAASGSDPSPTGSVAAGDAPRTEPEKRKRAHPNRHGRHKSKARHRLRYANR